MKRFVSFILILLFSAGLSISNGQVKDFLKKRKENAKESTGERVDREISKGINKGLDKLFGGEEQGKAEEEAGAAGETSGPGESVSSDGNAAAGIGMGAIMKGLGISGSANIKDSYDFDAFVEMTITSFDKKGEKDESGKYISYIDADSPTYGIAFTDENEEGESLMIFDAENKQMLTLVESDGEKTGFAVAFNEEQAAAIAEQYAEEVEDAEEAEDYTPYNIKKTGKTKKILGYTCHEYQTEDEENIVSIWATDDLDKKLDKTFMRNSNFSGMFFYAYYAQGFVMEYDILDKDDGDRTVMTVTDMDVDNVTSVKTAGYNIMSMGEMMQEEEEE